MKRPDFTAALRVLVEYGVDFLVVGGVAAVLQSAPVNTFDLDVVHSTEPANIARLLAALDRLDAYYRLQPERRLRPDETHLASPGHQLLMTRFGPVDVLGSIGNGRRYADLLPHAIEMDVGKEFRVRVLDLETLIATKQEVGQEKDLAALPVLRSALEESRRRKLPPNPSS
jgi:predicted nucleotidyltransferase